MSSSSCVWVAVPAHDPIASAGSTTVGRSVICDREGGLGQHRGREWTIQTTMGSCRPASSPSLRSRSRTVTAEATSPPTYEEWVRKTGFSGLGRSAAGPNAAGLTGLTPSSPLVPLPTRPFSSSCWASPRPRRTAIHQRRGSCAIVTQTCSLRSLCCFSEGT